MRKIVLALTVALVGFVGASATNTSANGATTITVTDNNSRFVTLKVTRNESVAQYILVCAIGATECTPENAENSTKVVRFDCYSAASHSTPHSCTDYNSISMNDHEYFPASPFSFFQKWRPNNPSNSGLLPGGTYNLKVFESANGLSGSYSQVAIQQFSFPQYTFTFDSAPTLNGEPLVGQTLTVSNVRWTPEPADVQYFWLRCKKEIPEYQDFSQFEEPPFTFGSLGSTDVDCLILNQDGSIKPPSLEIVSIRTQSISGFQSYTLTDADVDSFIVLQLIPTKDGGELRQYSLKSTARVEKKTKPINQAVPTVALKKTKKIKKLQIGATVTATVGTWKWSDANKYQWFSCTKRQRSSASVNTKTCTSIKRATKATYKVKKQDKGRFLLVSVTATNELGTTSLTSASTGKIK
jgi:hypothetical protein